MSFAFIVGNVNQLVVPWEFWEVDGRSSCGAEFRVWKHGGDGEINQLIKQINSMNPEDEEELKPFAWPDRKLSHLKWRGLVYEILRKVPNVALGFKGGVSMRTFP